MISVIIPTLNEEENIGRSLEGIRAEPHVSEIIVADGGSEDGTVELAERYPAVRIEKTTRGRGAQMNRGASSAQGNILFFLHADTVLQGGWARDIVAALEDKSVAGGAFTFKIECAKIKYRLVEQWVRLRCSLFTLPYGDQGIFVRRDVFDDIGGYRDIPVMEDVDLIEKMKRKGRVVILRRKAYTSERRWERRGLLRTAAMNQLIMALYRLGRDPRKLARMYYR
ncbi:MAG: TIGR04283 family arsenosugar biosynthesis glycosyltransferase [Nitrospirae bacterium]|nr:TIGR04283 family arsenosugar biosynthesis glycosyltransferase [Nitrospirota bacterium]